MSKQGEADELHRGIVAELRRGLSVVMVLARLGREQYGYTLLKELEAGGMAVDQNTLYPLLRRLESQGLLTSAWKVEEGRPRRYYARTALGTTVLKGLRAELAAQRTLLEEIEHEIR
jgi:PadR family transcriptional regulator, regulatory protein PadR